MGLTHRKEDACQGESPKRNPAIVQRISACRNGWKTWMIVVLMFPSAAFRPPISVVSE